MFGLSPKECEGDSIRTLLSRLWGSLSERALLWFVLYLSSLGRTLGAVVQGLRQAGHEHLWLILLPSAQVLEGLLFV